MPGLKFVHLQHNTNMHSNLKHACYTDVGAMGGGGGGAVGAVAPVKITKGGSAPQSSMQDMPQ